MPTEKPKLRGEAMPIEHGINVIEAARIEKALKEALADKELSKGITEQDAEILLKWVVDRITPHLIDTVQRNEGYMTTACGFCQAISATILAKIVPSETYLQTPLIQDILYPTDTTIDHALTVVRLPITKNDAVLMKAYLIDASFSQLIFPHPDLKDYEFKKKLFASEAGKSLAEKLLRDGFIPLTEEAASALLLAS